MSLNKIHNVYFIGIGGIGMSAIARYFNAQLKTVAGYDKTPTPITTQLKDLGIFISFSDDVAVLPTHFLDKENTLIVYTPAISSNNYLLTYFRNKDYNVLKRSEVLGNITANSFSFAVAGTHGKTTTSAILGHIMAVKNATAFLGGISNNYNSNLILGNAEISVVEADEFDRSFLHLSPDIACVTSIDADHLDIYKNAADLKNTFSLFANKVSNTLIVASGVDLPGLTYGIDDCSDYVAKDIKIQNGSYLFDVKTPTQTFKNITFSLPGKHNIMNALAALAMADVYKIPLEVIAAQLKTFTGVKRRFEYKIKHQNCALIDDYAHHPTEINAVESAVRDMYPNKEVLVVFQPHLYSRTKDFADDFAVALSKFNKVLLLDIYPAREAPIKGVTSAWLLSKINNPQKELVTATNLVSAIKASKVKIVVMLGAGDIGVLVDEVKNELLKEIDYGV